MSVNNPELEAKRKRMYPLAYALFEHEQFSGLLAEVAEHEVKILREDAITFLLTGKAHEAALVAAKAEGINQFLAGLKGLATKHTETKTSFSS